MKLIISYTVSDSCTYFTDVILPIEYDSAEALYIDFVDAIQKAFTNKNCQFEFGTESFNASDFYENLEEDQAKRYLEDPNMSKYVCKNAWGGYSFFSEPNFYTLDEWFNANKIS